MRFLIVVTALSAVALASGASVGSLSFNALLGTEDLVPAHLDSVQTKSGEPSAILGQLKSLLADPPSFDNIYANFLEKFNKEESSSDRSTVFIKNVLDIASHNLDFEAGKVSWSKGVNHFTDLTAEEFLQKFTGLTAQNSTIDPTLQPPGSIMAPTLTSAIGQEDSLDWRNNNAVTPIKDQGGCGSCVTFATNAIIESTFILRKQQTLDLSEQELVSCTTQNNGCNGGWYDASLNYVKDYGVASESTYPYTGRDDACERSTKSSRAISPSTSKWYNLQTQGDEDKLRDGVKNYGPMAVAVSVDQNDWSAYRGGIFNGACASNVNHALVVVGYGAENGQKYWIIKNSWNTWWGEKGYMRLARGVNKCLVANYGYIAYA